MRAEGGSMMATVLMTGILSMCALGAADDTEQAIEGVDYGDFSVSRLRCVIGNNKPLGEHRQRYNGIFSMASPDQPETPFVPFYAGFNLEHYFDGRPRNPDGNIFFEPRNAPMYFERLSDTAAELHQPTTPYFGVESWTRFELKEPYYIDVAFRCVPRKKMEGGFLGVFWASYMNGPLNKSIYFLNAGSTLDAPQWQQFCTQHHDHFSTVRHESDDGTIAFQEGEAVLWNQISPLKYSEPFFYGRIRNMVLLFIFEPGKHIRITHSPSGGGTSATGDDTNPAWDCQFLVPGYELNQEYGYRARLVYKPWVDRADVLNEVRTFRSTLHASE
jgi:hypothetical protein